MNEKAFVTVTALAKERGVHKVNMLRGIRRLEKETGRTFMHKLRGGKRQKQCWLTRADADEVLALLRDDRWPTRSARGRTSAITHSV